MTKIISDYYTRTQLPELIGKSLEPRYWHSQDEDLVWVECLEDSKLSCWIYYATLEDWTLNGNT